MTDASNNRNRIGRCYRVKLLMIQRSSKDVHVDIQKHQIPSSSHMKCNEKTKPMFHIFPKIYVQPNRQTGPNRSCSRPQLPPLKDPILVLSCPEIALILP